MLYYLLVGPVAVVTATSPVQATRGGGNDNYVCTCCVWYYTHSKDTSDTV